MVELPPVLGSFSRERVVILVTGRTAVSRIGGITAVARHVATARRLGLEPLVLYPGRMRALGAEIAGELDEAVQCLPSDDFDDEAGAEDAEVLVIAGDWYVSPHAVVAFSKGTQGAAVGRFTYRGRVTAPIARMTVAELKTVIPKLTEHPSGELISNALPDAAAVFPLEIAECHRLSDTVAVGRAEDKLFGRLGAKREVWHRRAFEKYLAIPITRHLARTPITPMQLSVAKTGAGLVAAWILAQGGYGYGLLGAVVFFGSRIADAVARDLARAAVREGSQGDASDVIGDFAVQIAVVWSLAIRPDAGAHAVAAAALATAGLGLSAWMAYDRVFRAIWRADDGHIAPRTPDNFASRFARRNGPAYALVLAALVGRLDLFLWGAAVASHLFYVAWLRAEAEPSR